MMRGRKLRRYFCPVVVSTCKRQDHLVLIHGQVLRRNRSHHPRNYLQAIT